jgi:uncharacterized protein (TIGR02757 family)
VIHIKKIQEQDGLKLLLDKKARQYERYEFIDTDPIQIPHSFDNKEDIEISGFLTATIAWGQRKNIIKSARELMSLMENKPYEFICNAGEKELKKIDSFVYRTFQAEDCIFFLRSLQHIYLNEGGLEKVFSDGYRQNRTIFNSLIYFHQTFLGTSHSLRSEKHVANIQANASAKRLNLFLRWMVRNSNNSVDFGIWKSIATASLMIPLDLHTGDTARRLGLLNRNQNDWKAVEELTSVLRIFDPDDPVKYDFALFGMGAFEES